LLHEVGRTPLLGLPGVGHDLPADVELWGKAEFLNPSGSVKDRAALAIFEAAISEHRLDGGRILLDASSGNTAVSYAFLGARLGIPVELCVPRNANPDRLAAIRSFGAHLHLTEPGEGTDGAQRAARRLAGAAPRRYYYPDQYNHPENPAAHYRTTGPEIWEQTGGRITHLVAGVGTGGTITGCARFLKERNPGLTVVAVEPDGPMHAIEGLKHLPTALRPGTYDVRLVDRTIRVSTEQALEMQRAIALREGMALGASSGAAVHAALKVGGELKQPAVVVTVLPDRDRTGASPREVR
jgi:cysteine synthase B